MWLKVERKLSELFHTSCYPYISSLLVGDERLPTLFEEPYMNEFANIIHKMLSGVTTGPADPAHGQKII